MNTEVVLAAGVAKHNLVIYSFTRSFAWHGLILEERADGKLVVFSFHDKSTVSVSKENCLPFSRGDYRTMCEKNFWNGIIVFWKGTPGRPILEGRLNPDAGPPGVEVFFRHQSEAERDKPWMPLQHCRLIGHEDDIR